MSSASVWVSGDTIVVGANAYGDGRQAASSFDRPVAGGNSFAQGAMLTPARTPSDGPTNDTFGSVVAVSGNTIVVGTLQGYSCCRGRRPPSRRYRFWDRRRACVRESAWPLGQNCSHRQQACRTRMPLADRRHMRRPTTMVSPLTQTESRTHHRCAARFGSSVLRTRFLQAASVLVTRRSRPAGCRPDSQDPLRPRLCRRRWRPAQAGVGGPAEHHRRTERRRLGHVVQPEVGWANTSTALLSVPLIRDTMAIVLPLIDTEPPKKQSPCGMR